MLETCNLLGCEACDTGTRVFSGVVGVWLTELATAAETAAAAACAAATCCAAACCATAAAACCATAAATLTGVFSSLLSPSLSWNYRENKFI